MVNQESAPTDLDEWRRERDGQRDEHLLVTWDDAEVMVAEIFAAVRHYFRRAWDEKVPEAREGGLGRSRERRG